MRLFKPTDMKYKLHQSDGPSIFKDTYLKVSAFKIFGIRIWSYIPVVESSFKGIYQIPHPSYGYLGCAWFQTNDELYEFMKTYDTYDKLELYLNNIKGDYNNRKIEYELKLAEKKKEYNLI